MEGSVREAHWQNAGLKHSAGAPCQGWDPEPGSGGQGKGNVTGKDPGKKLRGMRTRILAAKLNEGPRAQEK